MLVNQRCEDLDGNNRLLSQRGGGSYANECCRADLDDGAARCARSERGWGRSSGRVGALLATYVALAILQPHWRSLVERADGAVRGENISNNDEGKREALHNEQ